MNGDISQIVSQIMSNPEFGHLVSDLKSSGAVSGNPPSTDEVMKQLPAVMGMLGMNGAANSKNEEPAPTAASPVIAPEQLDKVIHIVKKMDNQKCEKLLGALKPYLRRERGEMIDKAMSVMKITDILGALQGVESGENKK